ncbi:MAG: CDF family Co(II)/Ni(II) efflux transporter DmeF [Pseudomonadales bacterium]|nr:CDF family Co(II)/Ni(II) efflux transporter DmeF [Pseudomonadales bacterium]
MNTKTIEDLKHTHNFAIDTSASERRVNLVFALTTVTMIVEIIAGTWFGSMALLADGWHMFTHSAAFAIAMFTYWYARKHQDNPDFSFGTGKVTSLGGFASAVALVVVALMMGIESIERLINPHSIHFEEAIAVAILGLIVNLLSAYLLRDDHHHHHGHSHDASHDHNLKAAYFHVLADTLTSVFAIAALVAGKYLGWIWMDALMGIIGAAVISKWAYNLIVESNTILLDKTPNQELANKIQDIIHKQETDNLLDLHIWKLSAEHSAAIISVATRSDHDTCFYKNLLSDLELTHVTIEIERITD